MKSIARPVPGAILIVLALIIFSCSKKREGQPRVLVFSKTAGYHHESIAEGNKAIMELGIRNKFDVDTTTDASMFNDDSLKKYSAVIFLSTTGDLLDNYQEAAFERYIQAGGGYVGIHAAADAEYDWGWYGRLVGGYFLTHPGIRDKYPNIQEAVLEVVDPNNISTKHLPKQWKRTDEYYSYKKLSDSTHILIKIDEKTYHGGYNGDNHPMAWYHDYDGGRAFYTGLGHTKESFSDENYLKHLLGGIEYAIGDNNVLDYTKARTQIPPEDNRFIKTQLVEGQFYEPTEMTILPNFDILILQRRGEIMLYKNDTKKVKQAGFLDVYFKAKNPNVNAEEGMLGLSKDPDFAQNNWVYIYYSPADSSVNRLSRFTLKNDTIDNKSEKVILEVKAQREICCHTGGSIAFGPDKLLYLSSGDNSTPFDETGVPYVTSGYAPLNDVPGHQQFDARRSAANSNDLRGKIMRIKVNADGTYDIPEGNLFPKGTPKTRPEIYVMGDRNPYRISVDQKNSFLYWGEVGPDAKSDSFDTRGPRGYDELNQARKAGFFGWPLFVANNLPYRAYDYATGKSGAAFDPQKPINDSRNNTGIRELPAVAPPFIWYPYDPSPDFLQVGSGGRNAMAGPVYYSDMFPAETRLPDYYNGKLLIYDWMRGWIKAVTMRPNGDFDKMEPFFGSIKLNSLIDMEIGPDGKLYLLEYGTGWFTKNPDAGLARIDFNAGNRPPVISGVTVDKTSGLLPFTVKAVVEAKDLEKNAMSYTWNLGDGTTKNTTTPDIAYTYTKPGDYNISVEVKDDQGAASNSEPVAIYAGNERPVVSIKLESANKSFYFPGVPVKYSVSVADNDSSKIDPANLYVSADYISGYVKPETLGHQQGHASMDGKSLMLALDCKSCHKENDKSVGPSYFQVSEKYQTQKDALDHLSKKVISGGGGVWGSTAMPAHPSLTPGDANKIVAWVLTLGAKKEIKKSLPAAGSVIPPVAKMAVTTSLVAVSPVLVLNASYTDKGGVNTRPLTGTGSASLRSNSVSFTGTEKTKGFSQFKYAGSTILIFPADNGWLALDNIDLSGVGTLNVLCGWQSAPASGPGFEVRLDDVNGKLIGKGSMPDPQKGQMFGVASIPIEKVNDGKLHAIYISYQAKQAISGGLTSVQFNP
jgi:cytochrome c